MRLFDKDSKANQEKDIIYISLADSTRENGCPVCRLIEKSEHKIIWTLLYEHVNDPYVRKIINEGNGFCSYHSWKIVSIAQNDPLLGGLGPAIIIEDLLKMYIMDIKNNKHAGVNCYICDELNKAEDSYISSFAIKINKTDLLKRYKDNDYSILCDRHFNEILNLVPMSMRDELKNLQLMKLRKLLENIESYISKQDYRYANTIKEEEARSWIQAVEAMKGLGWSSLSIKEIRRKK